MAAIGAIGALGSLASGYMTYKGQREANEANILMAREQMRFQERMSNTSFQRQMQDMRKAGINPIMAFGGGGASTPSGAMATSVNALSGTASSAQDALRLASEIAAIRANTAKSKAEREQVQIENKLLESKIPGAEIEKNIDSSGAGKFLHWWERFIGPFSKTVSSASDVVRSVKK